MARSGNFLEALIRCLIIGYMLYIATLQYFMNYDTLHQFNDTLHSVEGKSSRPQDEDFNENCNGHKQIHFMNVDKTECDQRGIRTFIKDHSRVVKNWSSPKSQGKYFSLMDHVEDWGPPFRPHFEAVVFHLFGSNSLDYEWRLASFRDTDFFRLNISAMILAGDGFEWDKNDKIIVCRQCHHSLTPRDLQKSEARHHGTCPFKRHRALQAVNEDDRQVNYVCYILTSGPPQRQTIFSGTGSTPSPDDSIPDNLYNIFFGHHNTAMEEPFIDVNPQTGNPPQTPHIYFPSMGRAPDLASGSDVVPGSADETGLDEATGGAPPED